MLSQPHLRPEKIQWAFVHAIAWLSSKTCVIKRYHVELWPVGTDGNFYAAGS